MAVIVGGIIWGISAGVGWVKDQFETAASAEEKATNCFAEAKNHPWKLKDCGPLARRFEVLHQREQAEQFRKDKGLTFKGTIGDQLECGP